MLAIRQYDWVLHLAMVALWAYLLAQSVTTYIGGKLEAVTEKEAAKIARPVAPERGEEEEEAGLEAYNVIVERNIFNSAASGVAAAAEELPPEQLGELGPAIKTNLDIKVLGTLVVGDGTDRRSSAVIVGGKGKGAEAYYPGEEPSFAPNVKLKLVAKDRIEFLNGGRLEYAELEDFASKKSVFASVEEAHGKAPSLKEEKERPETPEEPPSRASVAGKISVDQREVDEALQNLDKLMTEIRIVPNFKGGQPAGMKVLSVKPGSVISKLGIKRGDILEKINGEELDIKKGMELFSQMKDLKNFSLEISRGGKNQTLEYEIR
jgi:general secretion pathway protein C